MNRKANLRPFTGANDPRRQNGRKKGSKNLSTIVCELLDTNMTLTEPIDEGLKQYFGNSPTTYAKAIAMAMIIKAINGNVQASTWVSHYAENQAPDETDTGFFSQPVTIFEVVPNRPRPEEES
jgi:hypothetical protein